VFDLSERLDAGIYIFPSSTISVYFVQSRHTCVCTFFLEGDQLITFCQVVFESIERSNANFVFVKENTHVLVEPERRVDVCNIHFSIIGFLLFKSLCSITPGLCITECTQPLHNEV
jgi:hypothetical protein